MYDLKIDYVINIEDGMGGQVSWAEKCQMEFNPEKYEVLPQGKGTH